MTKNLFLTGPSGCGKSTAIADILGEALMKAGGFLTVRQTDEAGRAMAYWLRRPDGSDPQKIIHYFPKPYAMYPEVFETFGVQLLREAQGYDYVILDEIGGFEMLNEAFLAALMPLLESGVPCIGVMKGAGPASKMIQKLGLGEAYIQKSEQLRQWMRLDEDTTLYECSQFDPHARELIRAWKQQYVL